MANYCFNKLTIRGDTKQLIEFKDKVRGQDEEVLEFKNTIPTPPELDQTESPSNLPKTKQLDMILKYGHPDWYSWQIANWGCKWGPYTDSSSLDTNMYKNGKGKLVYSYDTPWSPPTQWIINTSKLFPTLKFENWCHEPGEGFKGTQIIMNGFIIKDNIMDT